MLGLMGIDFVTYLLALAALLFTLPSEVSISVDPIAALLAFASLLVTCGQSKKVRSCANPSQIQLPLAARVAR
jgi:hypothetical protein